MDGMDETGWTERRHYGNAINDKGNKAKIIGVNPSAMDG